MDLNVDGFNDILSGSYSRQEQPMAGTLQVLWGKADGTFKKAVTLNGTDDKPLIVPAGTGEQGMLESICTRPWALDWDYDGDLDLVVGNFAGKFCLFAGEGSGKFAPAAQPIKAGDAELKISGHHSDPFIVDWDKDGDLDLLSGSTNGGVQWAENTAGAKKTPVLKPFATLIAAPKEVRTEARPNEVTEPAGSTRVWAADMNGDGKLDILVGDTISLISPAAGLSEAEFKKRYADWNDAWTAAQKEMAAADGQAEMQAKQQNYMKLYEQRKEFMSEDRTGFVWVYLQK